MSYEEMVREWLQTTAVILKKNVEKRAVLENLDIVMLAFDEICDGG